MGRPRIYCKCGCGEKVKLGNNYINGGHFSRTINYWKLQSDPKLCSCGCGEYANPGNEYIRYHHPRGKTKYPERFQTPPLCKCGCGDNVTWNITSSGWNIFVYNHHKRAENYYDRFNSPPLCGCGCSKEVIWNRCTANWNMYIHNHHDNGMLGVQLSDERKRLIGLQHKGKEVSNEQRYKLSESGKQRFSDIEERIKCSCRMQGVSRKEWMGFTIGDYCDIWSDKEYKESIKERDNYICQNKDCWKTTNKLGIHHIDYNKKNCKPENLITVCMSCNARANFNRDYWAKYYINIMKGE